MEEIEQRERMLKIPEILERHSRHEKGFEKVGAWGGLGRARSHCRRGGAGRLSSPCSLFSYYMY